MCSASCGHVNMYREKNGICSYKILHAFYVSCIERNSLRRKAKDCKCMVTTCKKYQRVHACLYCIYFGCWAEKHIHEHAREKQHILAIDTNSGHVYCFKCGDYQYDAEFENIAQEHWLIAAHRKGIAVKWEPNPYEVAVLKKQHQIINIAKMGLRGIVNMGNTCYISVILQSLVHAPLFRDYFLTLQHKCSYQKNTSVSQDTISDSETPICFACEISDIVQEFFSGKEEPFVPHRLLHLLWNYGVFRGCEQQDAHELFLILLNNLHQNCQGSNGNSVSNHLCKCIIDTLFTGFSKYVYTCQQCCHEYSENTPFKDLTLISHMSTPDGPNDGSTSLGDCLSKSMMSVVNGVLCSKCNEKKPFNVHTILEKLPLIIIFHVNQLHEKKKFISFPEFLDMSPYMLSPKSQSNKEKSKNSNNIFYLFAVVEHKGNEKLGHYLCYVRRHKEGWFSCDDVSVKPVSVADVLKKKAYLLFYHKQILEYEVESLRDEKRLST